MQPPPPRDSEYNAFAPYQPAPPPRPYEDAQRFRGQGRPMGHDMNSRKRRRTGGAAPGRRTEYEKRDPENLEVRFLLHTHLAGAVIGKGGHYISHIRDETQIALQIHQSIPNVQVRVGVARGSVENLLKAFQLIGDKIVSQDREDKFSITLLLEQKNCGCVIGQKGCKISATRRDTRAGIKVSNEPLGDSTEKSIEIYGGKEEVYPALKVIIDQIATDPKAHPTVRKFLEENDMQNPYARDSYNRGRTSEYTTHVPMQPAYPSPALNQYQQYNPDPYKAPGAGPFQGPGPYAGAAGYSQGGISQAYQGGERGGYGYAAGPSRFQRNYSPYQSTPNYGGASAATPYRGRTYN